MASLPATSQLPRTGLSYAAVEMMRVDRCAGVGCRERSGGHRIEENDDRLDKGVGCRKERKRREADW
jgi:hypothetical protein